LANITDNGLNKIAQLSRPIEEQKVIKEDALLSGNNQIHLEFTEILHICIWYES